MSGDSPSTTAGRRVLVTGAGGQDGTYLCEKLTAEGAAVFGLVKPGGSACVQGVEPLEADLRDAAAVARAVESAQPDEVYHLAAVTFVPGSWRDPEAVEAVNVGGLRHLAAALFARRPDAKLCLASSAEIFAAGRDRPCSEDDELAPSTPYGRSKLAAHRFVSSLREREGRFACSAILCNHESPRRPTRFVTRKITSTVARIARGSAEKLVLGNLDATRDWGYAPEYMDAMLCMLRSDAPRDYVVATGRGTTVREFTRLAFERVGLDWRLCVEQDPALLRQGDAARRIGNPSRIARDLGWKAATSVEQLVAIMVDADLALLSQPAPASLRND